MARWLTKYGVDRCPYCRRYLCFEFRGEKRLRGATKKEIEVYRAASEKKTINARPREGE